MPGPQVCVSGCLRVVTRGMAVGGRFSGASGTPPPTACPGMGGSGSLPLIRPCGATFPQGGRQGLLLAAAGVSAGGNPGKDVGASLRGAAGTPPPAVCREWAAAGACPSSGPAGPPSPKGEGKGCCWRQRESPRVVTRGRTSAQASAGRRGRRPLRFARGRAAAGACPLPRQLILGAELEGQAVVPAV